MVEVTLGHSHSASLYSYTTELSGRGSGSIGWQAKELTQIIHTFQLCILQVVNVQLRQEVKRFQVIYKKCHRYFQ